MTAIIIIVVVALVFFVTICVVTFMVWKRENEMRTDSIKAIERNLEKLGAKLSEDNKFEEIEHEISEIREPRKRESLFGHNRSQRAIDPFSWMRTEKQETPLADPKLQDQSISGNKIMTELPVSPETSEMSWHDQSEDLDTEPIQRVESSGLIEDNTDYINAEIIQLKNGNGCDKYEQRPISTNSNDQDSNCQINCRNDRNNDKKMDYSDINVDHDTDEEIYSEIDLDFEEIRNLVSEIQLPEISEETVSEEEQEMLDSSNDKFTEVIKAPLTHDVGRSGRKYTAQELETLIKE